MLREWVSCLKSSYKAIKLLSHQAIKPLSHQAIKPSSHQAIKPILNFLR
ncbi:hypothetical protein HMPREF3230_00960 [Gardnerella vaginalis]|uniref:Uncharacterized protein n=1 Tax=Gardnerella vaginalis TaxID=2702 RepID=A0A135Z500_GARVA|nr:hypothetical protein HMPREF3230_00960 [Gardnerella vaginalis]